MIKHVGAVGLERLELQRLRDRVGRLFSALQEATEADDPLASGTWSPPVDLCETAKAIYVRIELPGVRAASVKIGLNSSKLRIRGEKKKRQTRQRIVSHLCSERAYGNFERVVPLRWTLSVKDATAELANGLLVIRLPKTPERRGTEFKVPITEVESGE